jgi:hypothetical protein
MQVGFTAQALSCSNAESSALIHTSENSTNNDGRLLGSPLHERMPHYYGIRQALYLGVCLTSTASICNQSGGSILEVRKLAKDRKAFASKLVGFLVKLPNKLIELPCTTCIERSAILGVAIQTNCNIRYNVVQGIRTLLPISVTLFWQ